MNTKFVAIGDVVTDAFVKLFPDSASVVDGEHPKLCFGYTDKIPFEDSYIVPAVGNSANAAVSAARLGLSSALVAAVGDDYYGGEIIETLKKENVGIGSINIEKGKKSNYHYVLWYKDDRTILIKHENYTYRLDRLEEPEWIYFSSVGEHALSFHDDVAHFLKEHPKTNLAFQPGTFQMKVGVERLRDIYTRTKLFICNREEAERILNAGTDDIPTLAAGICALGPEIVVITDGIGGAYTYENGNLWFMPPYPDPKPPFERTGAGDAFSSTFTAALALGLGIENAMRWAPINSMSVVQYVGAREGLLTREKLEAFLASAPADYKPQLLQK